MKVGMKVTVHKADNWDISIEEESIDFEGLFYGFANPNNSSTVLVMHSNGRLSHIGLNRVQFHLDSAPEPKENKEVIPEGTEVICYNGSIDNNHREEMYRGRFLKFAENSSAMVLRDDGNIIGHPLEWIKVVKQEEISEGDSSIQRRLKSI